MELEKQKDKSIEQVNEYREKVLNFEQELLDSGLAITGEEFDKVNPLKHKFADGCYIREIFMPKGQVITTGIHKKEHPYFILKGKVSVLTENGIEQFKAPHSGITQPGTKRLIYIHQDTLWTTVHATDKTNVEDVMKEIIAEDFDDPLVSIEVMHDKLKLKNK